ncbi:chorismate mutase, partial [Candidatus Woesearchaeota archaeon]|nr:chorismate mutase [Candidatus Woesearchaeota archaeon]
MDRLSYYRKSIDLIDKKIVKLLLIRFGLAKQIGNYKRKNKLNITGRR